MIIGIGVDLVDLKRFERAVARTPRLVERVFAESERAGSVATLAGRFAAKEAFMKAVGSAQGMAWHDVRVGKDSNGRPFISTFGSTAQATAAAGITKLHLSISHDAGVACAYVIAEGD